MKYKLYLFDFDYTLANAEIGIIISFQDVLHRYGYEDVSDELIKETIGMTVKNAFRLMTDVTDEEQLQTMRVEFSQKADEVMAVNTVLYPETIPMFQRIHEQGAKTGILSTKYRRRIMQTVEREHLEGLIDFIVGGEDVECAKPDKEGIFTAAQNAQVELSEILYVGDSEIDAQTAKNAGVDFVAVTTGTTDAKAFLEYPHVDILPNLADICV